MVLAAIGQICSSENIEDNLDQCRIVVEKAVAAGAKAVFFPEASDYLATSPTQSLSLCQSPKTSPFVRGLQDLAKKHSLPINVGIHEPSPTSPGEKMLNSQIQISSSGEIVQRYHKLHMFDMDRTSSGGKKMVESETVERGVELLKPYSIPELSTVKSSILHTFTNGDGNGDELLIGTNICFDLRFPESGIWARRMGAHVLLYPSAFMPETGKVHWEVLLRARAIETQSYVIAPAQVGGHNDGNRESYGESMVISPFGEILVRLGGLDDWKERNAGGKWEPEMGTFELSRKTVDDVRGEMPLMRRTDVYAEV